MNDSILKRMKEVEKAVLDLDESVRGAAFLVMQNYILGESHLEPDIKAELPPRRRTEKRGKAGTQNEELADSPKLEPPADYNRFIDMFDSESVSDNAKAIAAHLYREYGAEPFSLDEVRKLAKTGGVTIPERLDKTFLSATAEKKKLFKSAGKGIFRPSIYGEAYFKKTYGVKMGTKTRKAPASDSE